MRIAIIHQGMHIKGGAENLAVWLAAGLRDRGHQIRFIMQQFEPQYWDPEWFDNIEICKLSSPRFMGRSKLLMASAFTRQLTTLLDGIDLALAQMFPAYWWLNDARKKMQRPCKTAWFCQEPLRKLYYYATDRHLLEFHKYTPPDVDNEHMLSFAANRTNRSWLQRRRDARNRLLDAQAVRKCDVIFTNSHFTAENFELVFHRKPIPCHLGVPLPPEREHVSGHYIGVLTALAERKNVTNIIRGVHEAVVNLGITDLRVKIAGHGPDAQQLEQLVQQLGISSHVEFVGGLSDSDLSNFYHNARAIVYVPIDEPFGLVPLEAMALKTPVIVSDHGGPAEIVQHESTGLLLNPFDPRSIAGACERFWTDPELARKLGQSGFDRVHSYFSLDAFIDRFENILSELQT